MSWLIIDLEKSEVVYACNDYDLIKRVFEQYYLDGLSYREEDRYVIVFNPF